jgi:hypothetical protein
VLQALSTHDENSRELAGLFQKSLDNRGLPYPSLTRDKNYLTITSKSAIQPAPHFSQFRVTAHNSDGGR